MSLKMFLPITKVDAAQRLVYGVAAVEEVDKVNEVFDYKTSKPLFQKWSEDIAKATDGKSLGNVRAMHGKVAAGKLTDIQFNDDSRQIEVCSKVVDDNEWAKVEEGVYTGFSIGGSYAKRWQDGQATRYTAQPSEISLVDNPCQPSARFSMVKVDGSVEERPFAHKETSMTVTNEQVAERAKELAKAAGQEDKWPSHVEAARAELEKVVAPAVDNSAAAPAQEAAPAAAAAPNKPSDDLEQVWKARDGQTFKTKAEAKAHNEDLAKAQPAPTLSDALKDLQATVEKVESAPADGEDPCLAKLGDFEDAYWLAKKDYSDAKRKEMAGKGEAMKDGSFPIADKADLKNAVQAYGRAKDKVAAKAHIIARAKALDATDMLPADWEGSTKKADKAVKGHVLKGFERTKEGLEKGLSSVGRLACIVQDLEWLQQEAEWEATAEGDGSTVPQEIKEDIANLLNTLKNMLAEESKELFDAKELDVYAEMLEAAHRPAGIDALAKVLGDSAPALLAKVGAKVAPAPAVDDLTKALGDALAKAARLEKDVAEALPLIADMKARLEKIESMPRPRPGEGAVRVVEKSDDDAAGDVIAKTVQSNPEAVALALFQLAQRQPQRGFVPGR